jgi:Lipocalin-like domain
VWAVWTGSRAAWDDRTAFAGVLSPLTRPNSAPWLEIAIRRRAKESVMTNFKRRGAAALLVGLLAAPVTGAQTVAARDTPRFFGTWRLVSETQTGMMIYDSLGNMAAQVMPNRVRRKYAAAEPTPEEAKDAITGYLAYFGTYSVDEQTHIVTHHRKGNINPGGLGDDVVRAYVFESNDRLVLTPAGSTNKIVWERAR